MKWVSTDKWLTEGFVCQCSRPIGGPATGQVRTICHHSDPLCGRVSVATASAAAIVHRNSMAHIFIAGPAWASQQKQIDTYKLPAPFGSHDTFQMDKKGTFYSAKNLEKSLVTIVAMQ